MGSIHRHFFLNFLFFTPEAKESIILIFFENIDADGLHRDVDDPLFFIDKIEALNACNPALTKTAI
jgi:hypothetical protein